jgi:hypothetical protein
MTPSGIEPATFRVVAQCLNQLRHLVHHKFHMEWAVIEPQPLRQEIGDYLPTTQNNLILKGLLVGNLEIINQTERLCYTAKQLMW